MAEICLLFSKSNYKKIPFLREIYRNNSLYLGIYESLRESSNLQVVENQNFKVIFFGHLDGILNTNEILMNLKRDNIYFLAKIPGKYIAVVFNKITNETVIVRDQAGFQHVYCLFVKDYSIISTSLKLILKIARQTFQYYPNINNEGLAYYLTFQYLPNPHTMFEKISQLPLETFIRVTEKGQTYIKHLPFLSVDPPKIREKGDDIFDIKKLILQSLRRQMNSNVENVGAFLSGGMDTSTNVSLMVNELKVKPTVFTASFTEKDYDETADVRKIASFFGLDHQTITITPQLINKLPLIVKLYDNPHGDKSVFAEYFLCQIMKNKGIKYLVTGEGGDEIFGYPRTRDGDESLENLDDKNSLLGKKYLELTCLSTEKIRKKIFKDSLNKFNNLGEVYLESIYKKYSKRTPFERIYFGQWKTWLLEDVFMKDSRLSNFNQFRLITPYMDQDIMKYMSELRAETKIRGLKNKNYLRTIMRGKLPEQILKKPKHKFWLPFAEWFRNEWSGTMHETLFSKDSFILKFVNKPQLKKIINEHQKNHIDHSRLLWALMFLNTWYQDMENNIYNG